MKNVITTSYKEWNDFLEDDSFWDDDYIEEGCSYVGGKYVEEFPDDLNEKEIVTVQDGIVVLGENSKHGPYADRINLSALFKKWKRNKSYELVLVKIKKERLNDFLESIDSYGEIVK